METNKTIFTFWEPKNNIPGYLQLCMKTWEKFLPEYKIVVLDYSNLKDWIGENYFDKYLYKNFSLPKQADAIRIALLKKYGGIWLDVDTIITSENFKQLLNCNSDLITIGDSVAFIYANPQSKIIMKWDKIIKKKIELHKKSRNIFNYIFHYSYWRKFKDWAYLGNSILNRINKNKKKEEYCSLDYKEIFARPDIIYAETVGGGILKTI